MSKPNLFAEMDRIADALRDNNPDIRAAMRDELQQEFLQLQRMRMPHLSREQADELFEVWLLRDISHLVAARDKALSNIIAAIDETAARNGPGFQLRCKCGSVIDNPFDHDVIAEHSPHMRGRWHE